MSQPDARDTQDPDPRTLPEEATAAPVVHTRASLLARAALSAVIAVALLWYPVGRAAWAAAVADHGRFEDAAVVDLRGRITSTEATPGSTDAPHRTSETIVCEYGDEPRRSTFVEDEAYAVGDAVPVAFLDSSLRVSRVAPGAGALDVYFGLAGWVIDLLLIPIGLGVALAAVVNLASSASPPRAVERHPEG